MHTTNINTEHIQNFHQILKAATLEAHQSLETLAISSNLMRSDVTSNQYQHYLEVMHKMVSEAENRFFPELHSVFSDLAERRKSALIFNDLQALNGSITSGTNLIFGDDDKSLSFMAGIIYVIEGSTLGGRYILKNIESRLDFNNDAATSFLSGYGSKTGSMWKKFMSELSDYEIATQSSDEIIAGAQYAFEAIHAHFENSSTTL